MPIARPAPPSTGIDWNELKGSLLLFDVQSLEVGVNTTLGTKDAMRVDVTVLDGDHEGDVYADSLVFPKVLLAQLKPMAGAKVVGRLIQGDAKPGQNPPWKLADPTDAEMAAAELFDLTRNGLTGPAPAATGGVPAASDDAPF